METLVNSKSTHECPVLRVNELLKAPNSDNLSIVKIYEYTTLVRTQDWKAGDLAVFVPPDSLVDVTRPEFQFLAGKSKNNKYRVRAIKLRGVVSYGLLVKAPEGLQEGDNAADLLVVEHYEPELKTKEKRFGVTYGEAESGPHCPKYDVDAFMKYGREVFNEGELVVITEKLHGSNSKFIFKDDRMYCGSRTEWKKEIPSKPEIKYDDILAHVDGNIERAKEIYDSLQKKFEYWQPKKNIWWQVLEKYPQIRTFCERNPGCTLYGEVYGQVQDLNYGATQSDPFHFAAFDILAPQGFWLDWDVFYARCMEFNIPMVPHLMTTEFNFERMVSLANGNSVLPNATSQIREGVVIHPIKERWDERLGRVKLKVINPDYLAR